MTKTFHSRIIAPA